MADDIYKRPDWLEGKLYTQLSAQPDVVNFKKALELTGLDEIIDKSGYYSVFVPNDDAFESFFVENPQYSGDVENIPIDKLEQLVRSHIVQNGWTLEQLQTLDIAGWTDPLNPNYNEAKAFKRATILRDSLNKYFVRTDRGVDKIVLSESNANTYRVVAPTNRKYVPFFYPSYFEIFDYTSEDYEFYFGRPFINDGSVYISEAKIISEEIPAENGFIYKIDRVLKIRRNLEQIMLDMDSPADYDNFLNLIYLYPHFRYNSEETNKQEGAEEGLEVDSIFDLTYSPDLVIDIHDENTGPNQNYTIREQNTVLAPTDEALQYLYNNYVTINSGYPHWLTVNDVPNEILRIIANSHLADKVVYEKDLIEGFYNGEQDIITIAKADIIQKEYASNGTFLGLSKAIVPRAFKAVTGPVYLRPGYSTFMYALETSGILPALKRADKEYTLIVISDIQLAEDSSLLIDWIDKDLNRYRFNTLKRSEGIPLKRIRTPELTLKIMNQIVIGTPKYTANKEFLETIGGNYVVFDHLNNTIYGGKPTEYGYGSDSLITASYAPLEEEVDNGLTISSNTWIRNGDVDIFNDLNSNFPKFLNLLNKIGLASKSNLSLPFLSKGEFYTILAPSDSALIAIDADNLPVDSLEKILRFHFIKGSLIFTDGSKASGKYETMKIDEANSGQFVTVYEKINLDTGPDYITILNKDLSPYYTISEVPNETNRMTFVRLNTLLNTSEFLEYDYRTSGVIHKVNQVIMSN